MTLTPPDPTVPYAPDEALVVPARLENARAPLMPTPMPASIPIASVGAVRLSVAPTLRCATDPPPPTATLPMLAVSSPDTLLTATDAPVVNAPIEPPMAFVVTLRTAVVVTSIPPPACSSFAPVSTCAFCDPVSLITTTWAPTATKPPVPANARPFVFSGFISASTLIWPPPPEPAVMSAPGPTPASVLLWTLRIRTPAPTPTKPAATAPARPLTSRLSLAHTLTWPPAWTLPSMVAVVPADGTVLSALEATLPPGSAPPIAVVAPPRRAPILLFVFDWPWLDSQSAVSEAGPL